MIDYKFLRDTLISIIDNDKDISELWRFVPP